MPLTTQSILRIDLPEQEVDDLVTRALNQLEEIAEGEFSGRAFTFRDLVASDFPGFTNNEWLETSGTDNTYTTTTGADGTAIADDTILAIWAISIITPRITPVVTVFRITAGASLRAQVSLYDLWSVINTGTPAGEVSGQVKKGYLMTPVFITKQTNLTIESFNIEASVAYRPVFHGATAEIQGRTIEA